MSSPVLTGLVGRIACLGQCLPVARKHLQRLCPTADCAERMQAVPTQYAEQALEELRSRFGVEISSSGGIAQGAEPRLALTEDFEPVRGIVGTVCKEVMRREREQWVELGRAMPPRMTSEGWQHASRAAKEEPVNGWTVSHPGPPCASQTVSLAWA